MRLKRSLWRFIFVIEVIAFGAFYVMSPRGVHALNDLHAEMNKAEHDHALLVQEIAQLQQSIDDRKAYVFYTEKDARELLHCARPCEEVFFIG